ncbi:MAG: hypothetical protein K8F25_18825 [Fimbriimonadaceae bacterium]|nr:hypothetical protein [Alphaproteobacteria bacterium]
MADNAAERKRILRHALAYPFEPPRHSFQMHTGAAELEDIRISALDIAEFGDGIAPLVDLEVIAGETGSRRVYTARVPVIAAGSNASFQRLKTKFSEAGLDADFPVLLARIGELVPVYSAHISKYGSIPGTLTAEPGATSLLHIAFLDPAALRRVNESEALGFNYALALLEKLDIHLENRFTLPSACAYISRRGAFSPDGRPVRIDVFSVEKSALPMANQSQILAKLHQLVGPESAFEDFIHAHVDSRTRRDTSMRAMREKSFPCSISYFGWIEGERKGRQAALPEKFGY